MTGLPRGLDVYLYSDPCDVRRSFNTLTLVVEQKLGKTLAACDLFVFVAADRKRCKGTEPAASLIDRERDNSTRGRFDAMLLSG